jgi:bifunctional ADP-heptose synthase (sugar kinase/adenylyltransferase)
MYLANAASGVVVLEHGAAVCTIDALDNALTDTVAPVTWLDAKRQAHSTP